VERNKIKVVEKYNRRAELIEIKEYSLSLGIFISE
jgi:hypothetical protein